MEAYSFWCRERVDLGPDPGVSQATEEAVRRGSRSQARIAFSQEEDGQFVSNHTKREVIEHEEVQGTHVWSLPLEGQAVTVGPLSLRCTDKDPSSGSEGPTS